MRSVILALATALTLFPLHASTQELAPEDRAIADALFEKAAKLYEQGELLESAATLEQAFGYDPNPALAFNIAKAYDDAAEFERALQWYRVVQEHADAEESERKRATRAIERLEKTQATLGELDAERLRIEKEKQNTEAALAERMVGVETHDGFFFRMVLGVGYAFHTGKLSPERAAVLDTDKLSARGVAIAISSSLGWMVVENFAIHLGLLGSLIPNATIGGRAELNPSVSVGGLDLGATYYFMPANVYLSGNIFAAGVSVVVDQNAESTNTDDGYGLELLAAKEWWLSDNWGMGVGGQLLFAFTGNRDIEGIIFSISAAATLSLTYN